MENAARPVSATQPGRILVHICCGPCSIAPLKYLLKGTSEVCGFFHNPNIHPKKEFLLRLEAAKTLARHLSLSFCDEEAGRSIRAEGFRDPNATTPKGIKVPVLLRQIPKRRLRRLLQTASTHFVVFLYSTAEARR